MVNSKCAPVKICSSFWGLASKAARHAERPPIVPPDHGFNFFFLIIFEPLSLHFPCIIRIKIVSWCNVIDFYHRHTTQETYFFSFPAPMSTGQSSRSGSIEQRDSRAPTVVRLAVTCRWRRQMCSRWNRKANVENLKLGLVQYLLWMYEQTECLFF